MKTMTVAPASLHARSESFDPDTRTLHVVFTTGADVRRSPFFGDPYIERLRVDEQSLDLSRLNAGAPFLRDHLPSIDSVIGVVRRAWLEGGEGHAQIEMSARPELAPLIADMRAGILRQVSVGYNVDEYERHRPTDGEPLDVLEATRWQPMEISLVPYGADAGAQARSADTRHVARVTEAQMEDLNTTPDDETVAPATPDTDVAPETETAEQETPEGDESADTPEAPPDAAEAPLAPAAAEERARIVGITRAVRAARLPESVADGFIRGGTSLNAARAAVIERLAERDAAEETTTMAPVTETRRSDDHLKNCADALSLRFGHRLDKQPSREATELSNYTLLRIGETILSQRGLPTRGTRDQLITRMISTSDLTSLVATVTQRSLLGAYMEREVTFRPLARQVTANDFKDIERHRMSGAPELLLVPEGAEIEKGPLSAGAEKFRLHTYARRVALTRQALINDELDALSRLPAAFGAKARELENRMFYELLKSNPMMSDSNALFSGAHGNLMTGSDIDATNVALARQAMRKQVDPEGNAINITPAFMVVGPSQEVAAEQFLYPNGMVIYTAVTDLVPGSLRSLTLIVDSEITDDSWYLMAAPGAVDTFEYAYLGASAAGVSTGPGPQVDSRAGFEILGVDTRCILDYGVGVIDWVGVVKNPGA